MRFVIHSPVVPSVWSDSAFVRSKLAWCTRNSSMFLLWSMGLTSSSIWTSERVVPSGMMENPGSAHVPFGRNTVDIAAKAMVNSLLGRDGIH